MVRTGWRSLGVEGEPWPAWLRALRRRRGVYFLRDAGTGEVLYIGSSRYGRLYDTITRHFQEWTTAYATAGVTYLRDGFEAKVHIVGGEVLRPTPRGLPLTSVRHPRNEALARRVLDEEAAQIERKCPVDNRAGVEGCDEALSFAFGE